MKLKPSIYLILITCLLLIANISFSETTETNSLFDKLSGQISLKYITSEIDMKNSVITFTGDVEVLGKDLNMTCQKLEIYFKKSNEESSIEGRDLEKVIATGSVVITRPGWGLAKADEAVYYHDSEKIILTGEPYLKGREIKEVSGAKKITIDLGDGSYLIEGTKENRAKAEINIPGEEER